MQNKALHDAAAAKRRRALKTAAIPAFSAAALLLAFTFVIVPMIKKGRAGNTAPEAGETDRYAAAATAAPVTTAEPNGLPGSAENHLGGSDTNEGTDFDPIVGPGQWICGTPILDGGFYEPGNGSAYNAAMPDGGVLVIREGDGKVSFYLGAEMAARMYRCIGQLEPLDGAEVPDDELAEYVISLDFGNKTLRCISYSEGSFLINRDKVCTAGDELTRELERLVSEARA